MRRCFNPLHCGAVVASTSPHGGGARRKKVSIPFIAGQWSLQQEAAARAEAETRFNPLHCGAVVASWPRSGPSASITKVSIPFIAGQWSLLIAAVALIAAAIAFQSPSLRGSGRFKNGIIRDPAPPAGFNPLHCGAVVASSCAWRCGWPTPFAFQSPSLRGSGRFGIHNANNVGVGVVSIPFIAGQWSLQHESILPGGRYLLFQSPSLRGSGRFYRS